MITLPRLAFSFASVVLLAACSSSSSSGGGPVEGPADAHCGAKVQPTSQSACMSTGGGEGGAAMSDYGTTLYGTEGDDDDCKYHVSWSATDIGENQDVTFTIVATTKTDNMPLAGANPETEVFLNDTHPAPNSDSKATESPTGTYQIGPIRFDAPGKWTVRYHFFEQCSDGDEQSPHGHIAFYVNVP